MIDPEHKGRNCIGLGLHLCAQAPGRGLEGDISDAAYFDHHLRLAGHAQEREEHRHQEHNRCRGEYELVSMQATHREPP